jgi:TfoX/Sxy family transcriptional regulator of competence genes
MAFDENLAARIRTTLARNKGIDEKKMFGGLGFLHNGNILVGVWKNSMIACLGLEQAQEALREPHVGEFDITGKPMKGWVMISTDGVTSLDAVKVWVQRAFAFVRKLPAK